MSSRVSFLHIEEDIYSLVCAVVASYATTVAVVATVTYVAQSHHYDKREEQNQNVPRTYEEAMKVDGADNSVSASCHQFTATKENPNRKVCWPNGKEGIYDSEGNLVEDPRDIGTFNFFHPDDATGKFFHSVVDIFPWVLFGNSDEDPGPILNFFEKCLGD